MNVLVACEESQEVCKAFRALGHDAYSCDIQPCSGGHPEWHIQDDVLNYINGDNLPLNWKRCATFPMFLTQDGKLHTMPKKMGFDYCSSALYIPYKRRGKMVMGRWETESRQIQKRIGGRSIF